MTFSTLPMWNDECERPDLLRGKRGWTLVDYFNIGVAVCLVVITLGLLMPAITSVRETACRTRNINAQREQVGHPPASFFP